MGSMPCTALSCLGRPCMASHGTKAPELNGLMFSLRRFPPVEASVSEVLLSRG
jgi:hypothetical protein